MRRRNLVIFIFVFFHFLCGFSQVNSVQPSVEVSDHKGNKSVIAIECDYDFLPDKTIKLKANYPVIKRADEYQVSAIAYQPVGDFSQGYPVPEIKNLSGKKDDVFGQEIHLPFEFCFYDTTFHSFVLSDNGVLSFGNTNAYETCPYIVADNPPSKKLPKNAIFGLYHDLKNQSLAGKIKMYYAGEAPYRKFIINYDEVEVYGSSSLKSTFQIVLYETSNVIDIYVKNKPVNEAITPPVRNMSLIGLNNKDGEKGIAAPNRNKGIWTAQNEAYRFTPSGGTDPKVKWFDQAGNLIGEGDEIIVKPTYSTTYTAEVTYFLCKEEKVRQTIQVRFSSNFPTARDLEKRLCSTESSVAINLADYKSEINADSSLTFTFHNTQADAHSGANPIAENYTMTENEKVVYVRVLKEAACYIVSKITLKKTGRPQVPDNQTIKICNSYVDLSSLQVEGTAGYNTYFYNSMSDAQNQRNEISSLYVYGSQTLFVRVNNPSDVSCYTIVSLTINSGNQLYVNSYQAFVCNTIQGQRVFYDLTQHIPNLLNGTYNLADITATFYEYSDYSGKINTPENVLVTLNKRFYVELSYSGNCLVRTHLDVMYDDDCDGSETSSLISLPLPTMCNVTFPTTLDIENLYFYPYIENNSTLTRANITLHGIFFDSALTQPVANYNAYTFTQNTSLIMFASYTANGVKSSIAFPVMVSKKEALTNTNFIVCDPRPLGSQEIWLDNQSEYYERLKALYGDYTDEIFFFETQADRTNFYNDFQNGNKNLALTKHKVTLTTASNRFYASVVAYGCIYDYDLDITLKPLDEHVLNLEVCDFGPLYQEEEVDLSVYQADIQNLLTGKTIEEIKYYPTSDDAHSQNVNEISSYWAATISHPNNSIFARVSIQNECPVIVEMRFSYKNSVRLPEYQTSVVLCDVDNDNSENFVISNVVSSTSVDTNSVIEFYKTFDGAQNKTATDLIGTYSATPLTMNITQSVDVYMRVDDNSTGCNRIFTIPVKLTKYPVLQNKNVFICDYLNDQKETFTNDFITNVIVVLNGTIVNMSMSFEYFTSEADAQAGVNSVTQYTDAINDQKVWVKITPEGSHCSQINELTLKLVESPESKTITETICNNNTRNSGDNTNEMVDLDSYRQQYVSSGANISRYDFTYFESENDALFWNNPISNYGLITSFPKEFFVRVGSWDTGCFSIVKVVFQAHDALPVQDISPEMCGENGGYATRDLKDFVSDMLVGTATITDFRTNFFLTKHEAIAGFNEITDTEVTFTNNDTYWVKFTNSATNCFIFKKITFKVNPSAKMDGITKEICDTDFDGVFQINLDTYKNDIITGESLATINATYDFSYHKTEADVVSNTNALSAIHTFNITDFQQDTDEPNVLKTSVYARTITKDVNRCVSYSEITLKVKLIPLKSKSVSITTCDDISDDGIETFDLTAQEPSFSTATGVNFRYYLTESDMKNDVNAIANPSNFVNTSTYSQTIYVRVSQTDYCDNWATIDLKVSPYINVRNAAAIAPFCDYDDQGQQYALDLTAHIPFMSANVGSTLLGKLDISYYVSATDSDSKTNPITTPSNYVSSVGSHTIFVRFEDRETNCYQTRTITFERLANPSVPDVEKTICDTDFDTQFEVQLSNYASDIVSNTSSHTLTFFSNISDAKSMTNALVSPYGFSFSDLIEQAGKRTHQLSVRVTDHKGCVSYSRLTFVVPEKVNLATHRLSVTTCDDISDDGIETFDLTAQEPSFSTATGVNFRYYLTESDMKNDVNAIANPSNFVNTSTYSQTIYVRISQTDYCDNWATIDLKVSPYINVRNAAAIAPFCDYDDQGQQYALDLTAHIPFMSANVGSTLLGKLDISYYVSATDSDSKTNPITTPSNYVSSVGSHTIFVRFEDRETNCYQTRTITFERLANPSVPDVEKTICDTDFDTQFEVQLSNYASDIVSNTSSHTLTFFSNISDAKSMTNALVSPYGFSFSDLIEQAGKRTHQLSVRVTDHKGCVSYSRLTFVVPEKVNLATHRLSVTTCDDISDDGIETFDLTAQEPSFSTATGVNFRYYLTESDMKNDVNAIANPSNFVNTSTYSQTIYVRISQTDYCDNWATITLSVVPYISLNDTTLPYICKYTATGEEATLNLRDALPNLLSSVKPQMKNDLNISFHTSQADAQSNQNAIAQPEKIVIELGKHIFWARVESTKANCHNVAKIEAERLNYPLAKQHTAEICFDHVSQSYSIDLSQLKSVLAENIDNEYNIDFYHTAEDAKRNRNRIKYVVPFFLTSESKTLYTRVTNERGCVDFSEIKLNALPKLYFSVEVRESCLEDNPKQWIEILFADTSLNLSEVSYLINDTDINKAKPFTNFEGNVAVLDKSEFTLGTNQFITIFYKDCQYRNQTPFEITLINSLSVVDISDNDPYSRMISFKGVGGKPPYRFRVNGSHTNQTTYYVDPAKAQKNDESGRKVVTIEVSITDSLGCSATIPIRKEIIDIYVPNFFTPDNDGQNDTWTIGNTQSYPKMVVRIFDRYGRLLKTMNQKDSWDGTYRGVDLPSGDYWYEVRLNGVNDTRKFVGHFTLIR